MNNHRVTIYSGALDTNPDIKLFDSFYEAQDYIFDYILQELGPGYSQQDFEEFMQYVKLEEVEDESC